VVKFINGYKVYIISVAAFIYAILAMTKVAPNPQQLGDWLLVIAPAMAAFRSTLQKLIDLLAGK
jgi:hypothetical protein